MAGNGFIHGHRYVVFLVPFPLGVLRAGSQGYLLLEGRRK